MRWMSEQLCCHTHTHEHCCRRVTQLTSQLDVALASTDGLHNPRLSKYRAKHDHDRHTTFKLQCKLDTHNFEPLHLKSNTVIPTSICTIPIQSSRLLGKHTLLADNPRSYKLEPLDLFEPPSTSHNMHKDPSFKPVTKIHSILNFQIEPLRT